MITDSELHEILEGHRWIRVRRLVIPPGATPDESFRQLEAHHESETTYLIDKVRELARELLAHRGRQ